jgi:hypothetical protein
LISARTNIVPSASGVTRFRLEKKDPNAAVSEPVKPIVFYIDPATPAKWVPFVKRGIESWQPAFEAAGFRGAIVARDAPKDPEWSAEDARYSVVRWVPVTTETQSLIIDQRSGEILSAAVDVYRTSRRADRRVARAGGCGGRARSSCRCPTNSTADPAVLVAIKSVMRSASRTT